MLGAGMDWLFSHPISQVTAVRNSKYIWNIPHVTFLFYLFFYFIFLLLRISNSTSCTSLQPPLLAILPCRQLYNTIVSKIPIIPPRHNKFPFIFTVLHPPRFSPPPLHPQQYFTTCTSWCCSSLSQFLAFSFCHFHSNKDLLYSCLLCINYFLQHHGSSSNPNRAYWRSTQTPYDFQQKKVGVAEKGDRIVNIMRRGNLRHNVFEA